ncbi:MAG: PLP-dependent aminotransferase family protein [Betaproteobacteria bacterium]|nr:PLP-dependent aminotransferase family protein [Betaproteobacteria bacterium]
MTTLPPFDLNGAQPLVDQIVAALRGAIETRGLRPETRLPSIRQFATRQGVSRFTVVEAYDRLVAQGYLHSRRGSGFYVAARSAPAAGAAQPCSIERAVDTAMLMRNVLAAEASSTGYGSGVLPTDWLDDEALRRQLRALSKEGGPHLTTYGQGLGLAPLREQLRVQLTEIGIETSADQILLTHGGAQALDLVIRYLLKPGDSVLVDDPGYYNLFGNLKLHGVRLLGVPRGKDGPDLALAEKLALEARPKAFFTQSVLHNPTGTCLSPASAFRILQLAERHGFIVVEDDVAADFDPGRAARLATLDQLDRVLYLGSFSKTLSASLRVGFLVGKREWIEELTDIKLLSDITTSEFAERVVHRMLTEGHYRRHMQRMRERLARARDRVLRRMEHAGMEVLCEPLGGLFIWAKHPAWDNAVALANRAAREGVFLAPGSSFRPYLESSPWLRFNIARSDTPKLFESLARYSEELSSAAILT